MLTTSGAPRPTRTQNVLGQICRVQVALPCSGTFRCSDVYAQRMRVITHDERILSVPRSFGLDFQ